VTLGSFPVFLQSHHVHRTHGVEPGTHLAVDLVFKCQLLAGGDRDRAIGQQFMPLHTQFIEARLRHVLGV